MTLPVYTEPRPLCANRPVLNTCNKHQHELFYVGDGSHDNTRELIQKLIDTDKRVCLLALLGTSATVGTHNAAGDAVIMIDANGQFLPKPIPEFVPEWKDGTQVVVGVRESDQKGGFIKRFGSKFSYRVTSNRSLQPARPSYCRSSNVPLRRP